MREISAQRLLRTYNRIVDEHDRVCTIAALKEAVRTLLWRGFGRVDVVLYRVEGARRLYVFIPSAKTNPLSATRRSELPAPLLFGRACTVYRTF